MSNEAYKNLKRTFPKGIPFVVKFAIDDAIKEAKEEVFDDIEKINKIYRFLDDYNKYYQKIKKRHLSTFENKSNIIADKSNRQNP